MADSLKEDEKTGRGKDREYTFRSFIGDLVSLFLLSAISALIASGRKGQPPQVPSDKTPGAPPGPLTPTSGSEQTGESTGRRFLGPVLAAISVLLAAAMVYVFVVFPGTLIGPRQPIPFSHRVHAGVKGINCRFCHPFAERGKNAGIPAVEKCMFCHKHIIPLNPWLVKERDHYASGTPVIWRRVYYVPDYVKFRHQPHVKWAKVDCDHCHGPVETMDRLQTKHFSMGFCISCHRSHHAVVDCYLSCHH